jgi:hypothetical protein
MELTTRYCPNPHGTPYGKRGFGVPLVQRGADHGLPRLRCTRCEGPFSARQGTASCGGRAEEPHDPIALRALAEGHAWRSTGRLVEVDQDTVWDWLARAGRHGRAVTTSLCATLPLTACPVDAWWSFVRKKAAHLTGAERVLAL